MSAGLIAALGTAFAAPAAGAAAGAGLSGGLGLFGSILSGIGTGMMARTEARRAEQAKIDEEKRLEQRYAGAGEAVRYWDNPEGDAPAARVRAQKDPNTPLSRGKAASIPAGVAKIAFNPATQKVKFT